MHFKSKTLVTKKYNYMFYRGIYGGVHWMPFFYNTKEYKEIGWLLWVFTIHLNDKEEV